MISARPQETLRWCGWYARSSSRTVQGLLQGGRDLLDGFGHAVVDGIQREPQPAACPARLIPNVLRASRSLVSLLALTRWSASWRSTFSAKRRDTAFAAVFAPIRRVISSSASLVRLSPVALAISASLTRWSRSFRLPHALTSSCGTPRATWMRSPAGNRESHVCVRRCALGTRTRRLAAQLRCRAGVPTGRPSGRGSLPASSPRSAARGRTS